MNLRFKPGTGQAMPFGFGSGAKIGQIVVTDDSSGVCKSLGEVEAQVSRLRADLDDIIKAARAYFPS